MSAEALLLELPGRGRVLFSERSDGNMSSVGGEGAADGAGARERLRARIGVRRLVRGHQVHGNVVARVRDAARRPSSRGACDGQATAVAGVGAMVLVADCLPVALGCRRRRGDGARRLARAGRGRARGGGARRARARRRRARSSSRSSAPAPARAAMRSGPRCTPPSAAPTAAGRNIDLRAIAHERLLAAGVARVEHVRACTICDERFFSHRREGERAGRQAGVAWLS